jgi:tripartite-type tricarboxylate transporter receptor subunit TctC
VKDSEPLSHLTSYFLFVAVHPSIPARAFKELIALAKARPGTINFGSSGIGTTTHIAGELFNHMAGVKLVHVPYKSSGSNMISDSLAGVFQVQFNSPAIVPFIRSGKLVLIGVTGSKRSPLFPDVPTVAESVPGYEATGWNAVFAPAGTPRDIVVRLNAEIVRGLKQQDAIDSFAKLGMQPTTSTPEELGALVKSEVPKWARVIKAADIRPE